MTARWATACAERLGWKILPCWPKTKRAIYRHTEASNDPDQIEAWAEKHGDNLGWAVATGPGSGIIVIDVEDAEGECELVALEREHGALPDAYPMVWSGGGQGWHAYFRWPGFEVRNKRLGTKLEILKPEPMPERLVNRNDTCGSRYALRALEDEINRAATAPLRNRNNQLNASAHALFRFVAEGALSAHVIRDGLMAAAAHVGLPAYQAKATIRSAARSRGVSL